MSDSVSGNELVRLTELIEIAEQFRETIGSLVSALESDGFTKREAQSIVAGFWASRIKQDESEEKHE